MAENSNNFELNLFDALASLNKQSETLNEYINAFKSKTENVTGLNSVENSIIEEISPKSENLNFDELDQTALVQAQEKKSNEPFAIKEQASRKEEKISSPIAEQTISEEKIIDKITANLEKSLGDLVKEQNKDNPEKDSNTEKNSPVANKVNDFFKRIAQETNKPNEQTSLKENTVTEKKEDNTLQLLTPNVEKQLSELDYEISAPTKKEPTPQSNNSNSIVENNNLSKNIPSEFQTNTLNSSQPFANFTPNTFEPTLETYFQKQQTSEQLLTPENIKFNDIQTLQRIISPQTFLNQNINKYNQTFSNTTNFENLMSQDTASQTAQPSKDNTQFYTFQANTPLKEEQGNVLEPTNKETKTDKFTYQQQGIDFQNLTNEDSGENIASYFDGIDPTLQEILKNTELTNQALQGIVKILPALMVGGANQQPQSQPMSMPAMPSMGSLGGQGQSSPQNNIVEGTPQIPRIRNQFLASL